MKIKKSTLALYRIYRVSLGFFTSNFYTYKYQFKTSFYAGFLFLEIFLNTVSVNNSNT
jgi:hypothetical protein